MKAGGALAKAAGATEEVVSRVNNAANFVDRATSRVGVPVYGQIKDVGKIPNPFTKRMIEQDVMRMVDHLSNSTAWKPIRGLLPYGDKIEYTWGDLFRTRSGALRSQLRGSEVLGVQPTKRMMTRIAEASSGRQAAAAMIEDLPPMLQDAMLTQTYILSQQSGLLGMGAFDDAFKGAGRITEGFVEDMQNWRSSLLRESREAHDDFFAVKEKMRGDVRDAARKVGYDPQLAVRRFDVVSQKMMEIDSYIGYQLTGIPVIREQLVNAVNKVSPGFGVTAFNDVIRKRWAQGTSVNEMDRVGNIAVSKLTGGKYETLGQWLKEEPIFGSLDLDTYIDTLRQGHMRRSLGVFASRETLQAHAQRLDEGKLIANSVVDETNAIKKLTDEGFGEEAKHLRDYFGFTSRVGRDARKRKRTGRVNGVVSRERLTEHLIDRGVDAKRAEAVMQRFIDGMQADGFQAFKDRVAAAMQDYNYLRPDVEEGVVRNVLNLEARKNVDERRLEILMELANPLVSVTEGAAIARGQITSQGYLRSIYELGRKLKDRNGRALIRERVPGEDIANGIPVNAKWAGPLHDKVIHPYLWKEIQSATIIPEQRNASLKRLQSLLTGGYLASPRASVANVGGGIFTAAAAGIPIGSMVRSMVETFPELIKSIRDPDYVSPLLDELKRYVDVGSAKMSNIASVQARANQKTVQLRGLADESPEGLRRWIEEVVPNAYEEFIGVTGLDAFQAGEVWMKMSAFQAARRSGLESVRDAAELARISTFDYGELPLLMKRFKEMGLLLFPGFPFFMGGRTIAAAVDNPGTLAVADRLSDALIDVSLDEDEATQFRAAIANSWLEDDQGVPVPVWSTRKGAEGQTVARAIPLNQIVATNTLGANPFQFSSPFAESIVTGGLFSPIFEVGNAILTGTGEAPFSKRYGREVFAQEDTFTQKAADVAGFLIDSFTPGGLRAVASYDTEAGFKGALPAGMKALRNAIDPIPIPDDLAELNMTRQELAAGRELRNLSDEVIGLFSRSVQPVSINPNAPLSTLERNYAVAEWLLDQQVRQLEERAKFATPQQAERLDARAVALSEQFYEQWEPVFERLEAEGIL